MSEFTWSKWLARLVSVFAIVISIAALDGISALAGVRAFSSISPFISSGTSAFVRGGVFAIAGGVVFRGRATFVLDRGPQNLTSIAPSDVVLTADKDTKIAIDYHSTKFRFDMTAGLACPLSRLIARGGEIAYTVPPMDHINDRLAAAGLVQDGGAFIAKEFANSRYDGLMFAADFADTAPLPPTLVRQLIKETKDSGSSPGRRLDIGSYLNVDEQIIYKVYLMAGSKSVDIAGVPLRYHWRMTQSGAADVSDVEMYAQDWPANTVLTDFTKSERVASQYDIVSLFQTAGVFRQAHLSNPASFQKFVQDACRLRL